MPTQSPKSKLVSKILDAAGKKGTARTKLRAKMMKLSVAKLKAIAKKSGVGTSSRRSSAKKKTTTRRTPTRRTPTRRTASKKKKTAASASSSASKLSKAAKSRVAKLVRGIKAGKISAKRGKKSPADYATGTAKSRYAKFIKLYKGVRVPKGTSSSSSSKSTSIKAQYASIKSRSKKPYYLSRGYRVKGYVVGGGARGEGLIRPVPGTRAKSFHKLTKAQQKAVVKFLNTGAGKTLRGKRAPATAQLGKLLRQAARQKAAS